MLKSREDLFLIYRFQYILDSNIIHTIHTNTVRTFNIWYKIN